MQMIDNVGDANDNIMYKQQSHNNVMSSNQKYQCILCKNWNIQRVPTPDPNCQAFFGV